jgi:hypothetical protein
MPTEGAYTEPHNPARIATGFLHVLFFYLHLDLARVSFGLSYQTPYALLFCPMRATCPEQLSS